MEKEDLKKRDINRFNIRRARGDGDGDVDGEGEGEGEWMEMIKRMKLRQKKGKLCSSSIDDGRIVS